MRRDKVHDGVPNLDAMPIADLMAFWRLYRNPPLFVSRRLIGDTRPRYTKIARQFARYACTMAIAKSAIKAGNTDKAIAYLKRCATIYNHLPRDLRW